MLLMRFCSVSEMQSAICGLGGVAAYLRLQVLSLQSFSLRLLLLNSLLGCYKLSLG